MLFQEKVWREIEKIPYGKTTTYKIIAEKISIKTLEKELEKILDANQN